MNPLNSSEQEIEEAIKDGLSNHTGEWFNGFIAPGLNLNEEQLRDLLFYLTKAKRLKSNIQALIAQHTQEARLDELEHIKNGEKTLKQFITHTGVELEIVTYVFSADEINDRIRTLKSKTGDK